MAVAAQDKKTERPKSPGRKRLGKEVHEKIRTFFFKIRTFKSSHIYLGIKKATCTPRARCILKKKNPKTLKRSLTHLWLAFRLCANRM